MTIISGSSKGPAETRARREKLRLAIVGGGPGGLMSAHLMRSKYGMPLDITILEATDRLGGKIITRRFDKSPALYEAGVAEIYDYSMTGEDPLRDLITKTCGLSITPMDSEACVFRKYVYDDVDDLLEDYGPETVEAVKNFRKYCTQVLTPQQYYDGSSRDDNDSPLAWITQEDLLREQIPDPIARDYIRVMARSDIAADTRATTALNAVKNSLLDCDGYIGFYSIDGGNERLIEALAGLVQADVRLSHRVQSVRTLQDGSYTLSVLNNGRAETLDFDVVIVCLPHNWLSTISFEDDRLAKAVGDHIAYFDTPAHYLRLAILFETPFWQEQIEGSWFMTDAFGGCCVYDEGTRHPAGGKGVLNWLIAGSDVLAWTNMSDDALLEAAFCSLPDDLQVQARASVLEIKVHRHLASVNAIPGGSPVRGLRQNHLPEPVENPGFILTGDYLFDSTLNGLLDSADFATELAFSRLKELRYLSGEASERVPVALPVPSAKIDRAYFDHYRGAGPYGDVWRQFSNPDYLKNLAIKAWGLKTGARILIAGSASGELVMALREGGFDAFGIENNRTIHARTPAQAKPYNLFGSIVDMPFEDDSFDLVIESCLCHISGRRLITGVDECFRVSCNGLMMMSVHSDMPLKAIDELDLLRGVRRFASLWEWSEIMFDAGFELAVDSDSDLAGLWQLCVASGQATLCEDAESLRFMLYRKPAAQVVHISAVAGKPTAAMRSRQVTSAQVLDHVG